MMGLTISAGSRLDSDKMISSGCTRQSAVTHAKATMRFGILVIDRSMHNQPLEHLMEEKHRMVATPIGASGI